MGGQPACASRPACPRRLIREPPEPEPGGVGSETNPRGSVTAAHALTEHPGPPSETLPSLGPGVSCSVWRAPPPQAQSPISCPPDGSHTEARVRVRIQERRGHRAGAERGFQHASSRAGRNTGTGRPTAVLRAQGQAGSLGLLARARPPTRGGCFPGLSWDGGSPTGRRLPCSPGRGVGGGNSGTCVHVVLCPRHLTPTSAHTFGRSQAPQNLVVSTQTTRSPSPGGQAAP